MLFVDHKQAQRGRAESGGAQTPRSSSCVMRVPLVTLVTLLSISESALPNSRAGHAPRAPAKARVEPKSPRQKHPNAPGGLKEESFPVEEKKKEKRKNTLQTPRALKKNASGARRRMMRAAVCSQEGH